MPPPKPPVAPTLKKLSWAGDVDEEVDASLGVVVAEDWGTNKPTLIDTGRGLKLAGSSRAFLAADDAFSPAVVRSWLDIDFKKLKLLDKQLSFSLDVSQVGCGCNAAVYLVAMDRPASVLSSGYCDIQGYELADVAPCAELDLFEGNRKAAQATLHTQQGHGENGHCNQDGCSGNYGKDGSPKLYGPGSGGVDSSRPFRVAASFPKSRAGAMLHVRLSQGEDRDAHMFGARSSLLLDGHRDANFGRNRPPMDISDDDQRRTRDALNQGLVLVLSLWGGGKDDMSWLDGGCSGSWKK